MEKEPLSLQEEVLIDDWEKTKLAELQKKQRSIFDKNFLKQFNNENHENNTTKR